MVSNLSNPFNPLNDLGALDDIDSSYDDLNLLCGEDEIRAGLKSEQLFEALDYYLSLTKGQSSLPPRSLFDPAGLPRHLPTIFLVEVETQEDGRRDYRYRVFGTALAILFGVDQTGRLISEFPGQNRAARTARIFDIICRKVMPIRTAGEFVSRNGMPIFGEAILFPFGEGREVTHILADLDYDAPL